MYIDSLQLADFRNYEKLDIHFSKGTNILYGDNAQGKTNILESLYMTATTRSHKSVRDKDMIRFGCSEAHIRTVVIKGGIDYRVWCILFFSRRKIFRSLKTDRPAAAVLWIWSCASWTKVICII